MAFKKSIQINMHMLIINVQYIILVLYAKIHDYVIVRRTNLTAEVSLAVLSDNILMAPSSSPSKPFEENHIYPC